MFDYKEATLEEMVEHIKTSSTSLITRMKRYHRGVGNDDVVKKIDKAREYIKLEKVQQRLKDIDNV